LSPDEVLARYHRYLLAGPPSGVPTIARDGGRPVGLPTGPGTKNCRRSVSAEQACTSAHTSSGSGDQEVI
jgi:hypothetical protein